MDNRDAPSKQWSDLLEKIRDMKFAMLTTEDGEERLHSRPMATMAADEEGTLWFFTARSTRKAREVEIHSRVNLAYTDGGKDTFISVSGVAHLDDNHDKARELWNPMLKAWFPDGLDDPELILLRVEVEEAEYWDVTSKKMVTLFHLAKSLAGRGDRGQSSSNYGRVQPPGPGRF